MESIEIKTRRRNLFSNLQNLEFPISHSNPENLQARHEATARKPGEIHFNPIINLGRYLQYVKSPQSVGNYELVSF